MTREQYGTQYLEHLEFTVKIIQRAGERRDDALEIAQAAWVSGWVHIDSWRGDCALRTWVCGIAINAMRDEWRKRDVRSRGLRKIGCQEIEEERVTRAVLEREAMDAFERLRPIQKTALRAWMNGATLMNSTDKSSVRRGVQSLARAMGA